MKKIFAVLFIMAVFVNPCFSEDLRAYEQVEGTIGFTFDEESTGGWDAIELPSTIESCRHVVVQVNDGSGSVSDTREAFLWSFDSNGAEYFYSDEPGISMSLGKKAGEVIIYIKTAASGSDITVSVLR